MSKYTNFSLFLVMLSFIPFTLAVMFINLAFTEHLNFGTHLLVGSLFFFISMYMSPAEKMEELPNWFNSFRNIFYLVSIICFVSCLAVGGYEVYFVGRLGY